MRELRSQFNCAGEAECHGDPVSTTLHLLPQAASRSVSHIEGRC
jgi:hypothetical protein